MALTVPPKYLAKMFHPDINGTIVKVTDGITTYLLGNFEADLTEGHVYNVIKGAINFRHNADYFKGSWSRTTISCAFNNLPSIPGGATGLKRLSELITSTSVSKDASLYYYNNYANTSLDDCLNPFNGKIDKINSYDQTSMSITLACKGDEFDKKLLVKRLRDIYNVSDVHINELLKDHYETYASLIFGKWDQDVRGLAKIYRLNRFKTSAHAWLNVLPLITSSTYPLIYWYSVARNPMKKITNIYVTTDNGVSPMKVPSTYIKTDDTTRLNSSFVVSLTYNDGQNPATLVLSEIFTINSDRVSPFSGIYFNGIGSEYAHDNVDAIYRSAFVKATRRKEFTTSKRKVEGAIAWELDDPLRFVETVFGEKEARVKTAPNIYVEYIGALQNQAFNTTQTKNKFITAFYLVNTSDPKLSFVTPSPNTYVHWAYQFDKNNTWFAFTGGPASPPFKYHTTTDIGSPYYKSKAIFTQPLNATNMPFPEANPRLVLLCRYDGPQADGTALDLPTVASVDANGYPNNTFLSLAQARIILTLPYPENHTVAWLAGEGQKYENTFVNALCLPTNKFTTAMLIQDSSHIVMTILHKWLFGTALDTIIDIDPSREVYNPFMPIRYQLTDPDKTTRDVIEEISQWAFWRFDWAPVGKAKFIPIRFADKRQQSKFTNSDAILEFDVLYDDMKHNSFKALDADMSNLVNHLTIRHNWHEEVGKFRDSEQGYQTVYQNTTSQALYGVRKKTIEVKTMAREFGTVAGGLDGEAINMLSTFLIDDTGDGTSGFWSKIPQRFQFTVVGDKYTKVEVGDRVRISSSLDNHLKCGDESWAGKTFIVEEIQHNNGSVKNAREVTLKIMWVPDTTVVGRAILL